MTFKSSLLLGKHQEKFCIGGDIGKARETRTPQDMVKICRPSRFPQSVTANRDQKMKTMKTDIDLLKQEIEIHRLGRRMKTSTTQVPPDQAALSPLPPLV
ncbi:UNVERIFIED_CONTAM: hypothetical protein FKN15_020539 [Acipenser sinensis]